MFFGGNGSRERRPESPDANLRQIVNTTTQPLSLTAGNRVVYVVDDEPCMLDLLSILLEDEGYAVRRFEDPEAALRAYTLATPRPDLLIADFQMNSMNGLSLIRACRDLQPDQKTILTSGMAYAADSVDAAEKPDRFLLKPCTGQEFTSMVHIVLGE
jgi:CheY-like chemotaxis protein